MRIPGFEGRSRISTAVPQQTSMPGSRVGQQLAELGGKAAEFSSQLMARKKRSMDASDVATRTLDHQRDFINADMELRNNLRKDGYINPSFMAKKDGSKMTYADAVEKFWDDSIPEYQQGAASHEAKEAYLNNIRQLKDSSILSADKESATMFLNFNSEMLAEQGDQTVRDFLLHPHVSSDNLSTLHEQYVQSLVEAQDVENITPIMAENLTGQFQKKMALGFTQRLIEENRMDEARGFLYAGVFSKGDREALTTLEGVIEQGRVEEFIDSLPNNMTDRERRMAISEFKGRITSQAPTRFMYDGEPDIEQMSTRLSLSEVKRMLEKINTVRSSGLARETQMLTREGRALDQGIDEGTVDPTKIEDMDAINSYHTKLLEVRDLSDPDTQDEIDLDMFNRVVRIAGHGQGLQASRLPFDRQEEFINQLKPELVAELVADYMGETEIPPVIREQIERGGFLTRRAPDIMKKHISGQVARTRQLLMDDPGAWANEVWGDAINGSANPAQARIQTINSYFDQNNLNMHDIRYATNEEIDTFSRRYTNAANNRERAELILQERANWGESWLDVTRDYLTHSNIDDEALPAFLFNDPTAVERYLSVIGTDEAKETVRRIKNEREPDYIRAQNRVNGDDFVADFGRALSLQSTSSSGADGMVNSFNEAITNYAAILMGGDTNLSHKKAVDRAVQELLADNIQVVNHGRSSIMVPTGMSPMAMADPRRVEAWLEENGTPESIRGRIRMPETFGPQIEQLTGEKPTPEEVEERLQVAIEDNFFWATRSDGRGVILRFNDNGLHRNAPGPDNKPIYLEWNQIHTTTPEMENFMRGVTGGGN